MEDQPPKTLWPRLVFGVLILAGLAGAFVLGLVVGGAGEEDPLAEEEEEVVFVQPPDPCAVDPADQPRHCLTHEAFPRQFVADFRSWPSNCWVIVDELVYNVTASEGYQYPGPGGLDHLCGTDVTEKFTADLAPPPPVEYLVGEIP